jgi:hypothetical protein
MEGFSLEDAPEFELWLEAERERQRELFGQLCGRVGRLQAEDCSDLSGGMVQRGQADRLAEAALASRFQNFAEALDGREDLHILEQKPEDE